MMESLSADITLRSPRPPVYRSAAQDRREAETAGFYQQNAEDYAASTLTLNVSNSIAKFVQLLPRGARVLDVGCGAGRDLLALDQAGLEPVGLDLSPELAAIAQQVSGRCVAVGDLRRPPFQPQEFHGIWAMASLLHLDRREVSGALAHLFELLIPGGVFFASVKRGRGIVQDKDGRWFTLYDADGWAGHLNSAGFEITELIGEPPASAGVNGSVAPGWVSSIARRPC